MKSAVINKIGLRIDIKLMYELTLLEILSSERDLQTIRL